MDFNTRYLASGYVAKSYPFGLFETKGGGIYVYRLYIHDISQGMAKCIKCMIRCDRATSCKKKDFLSRRLRQGRSRCTSSMPRNLQRLCGNSAPTALSNYQKNEAKPYLSLYVHITNASKITPGHIMHWWTHSDKLTHSESWPGLSAPKMRWS